MTVFNLFANDFLGFGGGIQAIAACCGVGVVGHFQSFARRQAVVFIKDNDKDTPDSTCCNEEQFVYTWIHYGPRHDRIIHPDSKDLAKTRGLL
jgi:hypothetical protein